MDISVTPSNMSVTSPSTQVGRADAGLNERQTVDAVGTPHSNAACLQLTVRVQNVPALSGGVSCVFEDLSETPGEVLSKGQVVCMSPSLREPPAQRQSHGETHTHTHTVGCEV